MVPGERRESWRDSGGGLAGEHGPHNLSGRERRVSVKLNKPVEKG